MFYQKLADKAQLREPLRSAFINEMTASPNQSIIHLDGTKKGEVYTPDEWTAVKKNSTFDITPHQNTVERLNGFKADGRADELIQKYTSETWFTSDEDGGWLDGKRNYPFDEAGLGKELAELAEKEPLIAEKVLEKLTAANRTADSAQVGRAMVNQMSDEQLVSFALNERGRVLLGKISNQVTEQSSIDEQGDWFGKDETAINANKIAQERIAKAKEQALIQLKKQSQNASGDSPIWAREGDLPRVLNDKEIPNGGSPDINVELPKSGIGFVIYNPNDSPYETSVVINGQKVNAGTMAKSDQVGTGETIQNV